MKVFITGGAGFIGSHLAERLLADGHEVVVMDNESTGDPDNIRGLLDHPAFEYHKASVTEDKDLVATLVADSDTTIHLAAAVGVRLIVEEPVHTIETNVHGTETVLRAAVEKSTPVMLASTSEVYGKSDKDRFSEGHDLVLGPTTHARWSYACSKALDEWLGLAYHRDKGVPVTVLRFFNTVGPRQTGQYGMVLPTFAAAALSGERITVHDDGQQTRCFCHVRDVVESIVRLMHADDAVGEVFNIGADQEVSIHDLAMRVRAAAESDSPIVFQEYEEAFEEGFEDMRRRKPDVRKLERTIGFRPATSLDDIIADVIADQRARLATA